RALFPFPVATHGWPVPQDSSFDIVSLVDWMEVQNAVQQAHREIQQRFDFKGSAAGVQLEGKDKIILTADSEYQLRNVRDLLDQKLVRRGVSPKAVDSGAVEPAAKATVRQELSLVSGLTADLAKDLAKFIRGLSVRVQTTIQGEQVRVS